MGLTSPLLSSYSRLMYLHILPCISQVFCAGWSLGPSSNFPVCQPANISHMLKFQHRSIDVCLLTYIYLYAIHHHCSTTFLVVLWMVTRCSAHGILHMLTIFPHTDCYYTIDFAIGFFPPLFVCYNHSTCMTLWYRFNCSMETRKPLLLLHSKGRREYWIG